MTDATEIYYGAREGQRGPFSRDQVSALVQAGSITAATPVWHQGMPEWLPLARSSLAGLLAPAASSAALPPVAAGEPPVTSFGQAVARSTAKYATFSGRANRPEFWFTMVGIVLLGIVGNVFDLVLLSAGFQVPFFAGIVSLACLLPELAVMARRLHDTDRSAWWLLIMLVPLVGIVVLIVFWCGKGTDGPNRFGP